MLDGGLIHRTEELTTDNFASFQNIFLDSMRATNPSAATYSQQLIDLIGLIVQKAMAADPFLWSFLSNPTEENVRRFINTLAKVLTEHN